MPPSGRFAPENLELFKAYQNPVFFIGFSGYLSESLASEFGYRAAADSESANAAVQVFLPEEPGEIYVNRYFSTVRRP